MPPDKTYDMCKALCKEVSESVLDCINERFDAFEAPLSFSHLQPQAELQAHVANQEQATSDLDVCVLALKAKCTKLAGRNTQLHNKMLDLEACSRRHNIKILGI